MSKQVPQNQSVAQLNRLKHQFSRLSSTTSASTNASHPSQAPLSPEALSLVSDKRLLRFYSKDKISSRKRLRTALEFTRAATIKERSLFYLSYRDAVYEVIRTTINQYESLNTDVDYVRDKNEKTGFMSKLGLKKRIGVEVRVKKLFNSINCCKLTRSLPRFAWGRTGEMCSRLCTSLYFSLVI
tara:strand:+ start:147 stop:698 length:552 start_codon:yes stop_codon:yes gene_type:complete